MKPSYTVENSTIEYTPCDYIGNLDWFNIAKCARERMKNNVSDEERWRRERKTFYASLDMLKVIRVKYIVKQES